jgi:hypothetical protein
MPNRTAIPAVPWNDRRTPLRIRGSSWYTVRKSKQSPTQFCCKY